MRTRNSKLINFILEFSQIALVFLGVYSALMCSGTSLGLTYDRGLLALIMMGASVLFYGLFTVLETFHNGKFYGILGITLFYIALGIRFMGALKKGFVTIVNSFLKEFMNYTGSSLTLLSYNDSETASVNFCTSLILILLGVYLIAIISAFFYRRRRSIVFIVGTVPFVLLPLLVGKLGYFSNLFTYLIVAIAVVGTRHLRTDATDRRMRQKLSIILMLVGLLAGAISYAYMPPSRYDGGKKRITQMKNSMMALGSWDAEDVWSWVKAYFNEDAIDYGKVGKKDQLVYSGETMLKISGDLNTEHGLYLKSYTGDTYEKNKWASLRKNEDYKQELAALEAEGLSPDNWHVHLRNQLGDSETSGVDNVWNTGTLTIRNIAFGYGNYLVPYEPSSGFKSEDNGRSTIEIPGIHYAIEYYTVYSQVMKRDFYNHNYSLANALIWDSNKEERQKMTDFVKKYYLQVPDSVNTVCEDFKAYLKNNGDLEAKYKAGSADEADMVRAVKQYIMADTTYTLSPGKTPSGKETVEYFLKENKKGYCTYYATTAAVLLRSVGVPARYVEGMYVPKEELAQGAESKEVSVPDKDAHAWIEVYTEYYGFVPVEVTPGQGEQDEDTSVNPPTQTDNNNTDSNQNKNNTTTEEPDIATPTPTVTETPEESMTFDDIDGNEDAPEEKGQAQSEQSGGRKVLYRILEILGIIIVILAALEIQRRLRQHFFLRNQNSLKPKRRIRMIYHHLLPVFIGRGVLFRGQSMAGYTADIARAMRIPEADMKEFVELLFHARFGPDNITKEQTEAFFETYKKIRQKAYSDAKIMKKLYYMYIMAL